MSDLNDRLLAEIERREHKHRAIMPMRDIVDRHRDTEPLAYLAALRRIVELHGADPDDGMGYDPDPGEGGVYGHMSNVCMTCGTADEYAVRLPCKTLLAIATALGVKA